MIEAAWVTCGTELKAKSHSVRSPYTRWNNSSSQVHICWKASLTHNERLVLIHLDYTHKCECTAGKKINNLHDERCQNEISQTIDFTDFSCTFISLYEIFYSLVTHIWVVNPSAFLIRNWQYETGK